MEICHNGLFCGLTEKLQVDDTFVALLCYYLGLVQHNT
jgi:hypothetical protein